jgi:hypothetical protein
MEKFTKLNTSKKVEPTDNIKYKGKNHNVVVYRDWEFIEQPNMVIILPYIKDEGYILLRHEPIPTFQYFFKDTDNYKNITHFLTVISETVEKDESLKNAVRRGLYEEAGIVLSELYDIDIEKSLFLNKSNTGIYHICLLELNYNDYRVTEPKTDGSQYEKNSKTIKISLGDIDEIRSHDLITDYMLTKLKLEYKLK